MTEEPQKSPSNSFPFAAIGWAFSLAVTAVALVTGVIAIIQFAQQKSVTLEAEFFPSEIAFAQPTMDLQRREHQHADVIRDALGASNSFENVTVAGKTAKLDISDLATKIATEDMKRAGPLAKLQLPPDGQMRIVITNMGELPANKVRVFVPRIDVYLMKAGDEFVVIPHTDDGADVGQINQGRSVEVFAFTRYGYDYDNGYCTFDCDVSVSHDQGVGTATVRAPRTLYSAVMSQGFLFVMVLGVIATVGVIGTVAIIGNAIQQAYKSVVEQRPQS